MTDPTTKRATTATEIDRARAERERAWAGYERARQSSSRATEVCPAHVPPNDLGGEPVVRPSAENTATGKHECEACVDLRAELASLRAALDVEGGLAEEREANLHGEVDRLTRQRDELRDAILYTTELYAEPVRYTTGKGKLRPNLSLGFETRYQDMYALARRALDGGRTDG